MLLYDEIIISGGGMNGITLIGAIYEFLKIYPIKNIKYLTGCSVGGILCMLLNIGYTTEEIRDIFLGIDFSYFQEIKIVNFINHLGLDNADKLKNLFKACFLNKNISPNITFQELFEKTNKILTVNSVNYTNGSIEYFNKDLSPDLSVIMGIRMSMSIPLLFTPIEYKGNLYIDGALLEPYPYLFNKNTKKMGFYYINENELSLFKKELPIFPKNDLFQFILNIVSILWIRQFKSMIKKKNFKKNTILLNNSFSSFDFSLGQEIKNKMFHYGSDKFKKIYKKKFKKENDKFLLKKYFYLLKYFTSN